MPTVAEHTVVRPVCRNRTDRRNGDVINNKHNNCKDRQSQNTVRYDLIDLIGNGKTAVVLFLVALLDDGSNVNIALVRDDAFRVVIKLFFSRFNVRFNVLAIVLRKAQLLNDFLVALKDLNREEALLLLGEGMYGNLFNVCNRVLNHTAEAVLRDRLRVLGCMDSGFCCFLNSGALQSGNLNDLAAERLAQCVGVDLVAVLIYDVHHVDRNNDRNTELNELGGQVEVALKVRTIDNIKDGFRSLLNEVVTCNNFFQRVRRKGVDTRQVRDHNVVVLLQLPFLLLDRNARPVADELVGAGQRVEQRCFTAVRVAGKGNFDLHLLLISFR